MKFHEIFREMKILTKKIKLMFFLIFILIIADTCL
jgi:predicted nucleic acid-binding Zn ribbon protein